MNLDRILELLAKRMGNEASEAELAELEELLRQDPHDRDIVSILQSIQSKKLKQPAHNEELVVNEAWGKMEQMLGEAPGEGVSTAAPGRVRRMFGRRAVRWAAVWIGVIGVSAVGYMVASRGRHSDAHGAGTLAAIQEAVASGRPKRITLPDGSLVWINAASKISYTEDQHTDNVYLEGEAYFNVRHNADRAFVVHAGNISVKALGTEFNVQAYPGEDHVEATLISGKVQVTMAEKPDQQIILAPNEKFTFSNKKVVKEMSYEVKPVKVVPSLQEVREVAWMQDQLAFKDEPFGDLARRMERRYDVHLVFEDEVLKKEPLSGVFKNEDIGKALRILQMTTPFQYKIKGDSILLWTRHDTGN